VGEVVRPAKKGCSAEGRTDDTKNGCAPPPPPPREPAVGIAELVAT